MSAQDPGAMTPPRRSGTIPRVDRRPRVDPALRSRLLAELRTGQRREAAARLPAGRIAGLIEVRACGSSTGDGDVSGIALYLGR